MQKKINTRAGQIIFSVLLIFILILISPLPLYPDESGNYQPGSSNEVFDYILIIDESGSMKKNDPENKRLDAAKLFIDMNAILSDENRVCIIGFGETVNVYFGLEVIDGNQQAIKSAIDQIQSSQPLTDMKAAFLKANEILSNRILRNNGAIIFLTDGSLTLDDIPRESQKDQTQQQEAEKDESGPVRVRPSTPEDGDSPLSSNNSQGVGMKSKNNDIPLAYDKNKTEKPQIDYLENYKKELLNTCLGLSLNEVKIYPIAFTDEAEAGLLEEMALATSTAAYYAESAKEIRDAFLDIFKSITNRFISVHDQQSSNEITGKTEMKEYIKDFFIVAFKNDFNKDSDVKIQISSEDTGVRTEIIDENEYQIVNILSNTDAIISYSISGDAVFIYDIAQSTILKPDDQYYISGSEIPVKIQLELPDSTGSIKDYEDFSINYSMKHPEGFTDSDIELLYEIGTYKDFTGAVFSGFSQKMYMKGNYSIEFLINHIKTVSTASEKKLISIIDPGFTFEILKPGKNDELTSYNATDPMHIETKIKFKDDYVLEKDTEDIKIFFNITGPDGGIKKDLILNPEDSGLDATDKSLVFSADINDLKSPGTYYLEFFIRDPSYVNRMSTGKGIYFQIIEPEEIQDNSSENVSAVGQEEEIKVETSPDNETGSINILIIILLIFGAVVLAVAAFLLYIKFRNK